MRFKLRGKIKTTDSEKNQASASTRKIITNPAPVVGAAAIADSEKRDQAINFNAVMENKPVLGAIVVRDVVTSSSVLGLGVDYVDKKAKEKHEMLVSQVINAQAVNTRK